MNYTEPIPNKKGKYDVIVVGGGIAGVSAAVSAAICGASVLLLEKQVNLRRSVHHWLDIMVRTAL